MENHSDNEEQELEDECKGAGQDCRPVSVPECLHVHGSRIELQIVRRRFLVQAQKFDARLATECHTHIGAQGLDHDLLLVIGLRFGVYNLFDHLRRNDSVLAEQESLLDLATDRE